MAGLLDYQMPAQTAMDDPRTVGLLKLATGLLQAGGQSARPVGFGQALGAAGGEAMGAYQAQKQLAQKDAMEKIQMQAALMKLQKETELQDMFTKMFKGESPAAGGKVFGVLDANGRQVGPGVGGPVPQNMQQSPQQSGLPGGIDPRAAGMAYVLGGGKELAGEMLKRSAPNMQIHNGVAVDMNRVSPGFQPGLQVSNNGQATQIEIGPDGKPVISAPKGAVDTFSGYQVAENQFKPPFSMQTPSNANIQLFPTEIPAFQKGILPGRLMPSEARTPAGLQALRGDSGSNIVSGKFNTAQGKVDGQFDISQLGPIGVGPTDAQRTQREIDAKRAEGFATLPKDLVQASHTQALGAIDTAESANRMLAALKTNNVITGPGASVRMKIAQIGAMIGAGGDTEQERIANTRSIIKSMAEFTVGARKSMAGQGTITDSEQKIAEKAASGSIDDLTPIELNMLATAAQKSSQKLWERHNTNLSTMKKDPQAVSTAAYFEVPQLPVMELPSNPIASNLVRGGVYNVKAKGEPQGKPRKWDGFKFQEIQ